MNKFAWVIIIVAAAIIGFVLYAALNGRSLPGTSYKDFPGAPAAKTR